MAAPKLGSGRRGDSRGEKHAAMWPHYASRPGECKACQPAATRAVRPLLTATPRSRSVLGMNSLVVRAAARALLDLVRGRRVRRAGLLDERTFALILAPHGERRRAEPEPNAERDHGAPAMLVFALEPGAPHVRLEAPRPLSRRLTAQLGEAPARLAGTEIQAVDPIGIERILAVTLAPPAAAETASAPPLVLYFELLARTPFLVITEEGKVVA